MSTPERIWKKRAAHVARRVNTAWFFQKTTPFLIGGGFLFAIAVLCLRTLRPLWVNSLWLAIGGSIALLLGGIISLLLARKHFIDQKAGLVRLDDRLSLHNSLTAASQGVGDWPEESPGHTEQKNAGLTWNFTAVLLPMCSALILVLGSFFVPIPNLEAASKKLPPNEPGAWEQMEEWITALEEENLFDETRIDEARDKIDELRNQPEDEWFSHSSMEATDSLRDALGRDLQKAAQEMETLERDLAALQSYSGTMSDEAREMLMKEYDEALKNLGLNGMALNEEMMKQLKNMDLSKLSQAQMNQLTKEQMEQLREKLKSGGQ